MIVCYGVRYVGKGSKNYVSLDWSNEKSAGVWDMEANSVVSDEERSVLSLPPSAASTL
jgi:hypothetical protein